VKGEKWREKKLKVKRELVEEPKIYYFPHRGSTFLRNGNVKRLA
jgi:hypothetical protein